MRHKILAAGSVALMGAGSFLGASAANAFTNADCVGSNTDFSELNIGLIGDSTTLCFAAAVGAGEYTFMPPAGTTAIEVVLIGGGGGASQSNSTGYGGNGGAVTFIDDVNPTDTLEIYLGEGGAAGQNNDGVGGEASTLTTADADWNAVGGDGGVYALGESGSGFPFGVGNNLTQHGGGAAAAGTSTDAGAGWQLTDPALVGADNPLWPRPTDIESTFAAGGYGNSNENDDNWGNGGDAYLDNSTWITEDGEDGAVEIRYTLGGPLASTGVDAAPMGIAAAGMLVTGGIGLAIARRARRSK